MGRRGGRKGAGQGRKPAKILRKTCIKKVSRSPTRASIPRDEGDEGGRQPLRAAKCGRSAGDLVDGKVIGDTFRDGALDTFTMDECIDGYREGLLMMYEGSREKLPFLRYRLGKRVPARKYHPIRW